MTELSKGIIEKTCGDVGKMANRGNVRNGNWNGADSTNSRSGGNPEHPILRRISDPYRGKVKVHVVVRFGQRKIIARGIVRFGIGGIGSFMMIMQIKIGRIPQM